MCEPGQIGSPGLLLAKNPDYNHLACVGHLSEIAWLHRPPGWRNPLSSCAEQEAAIAPYPAHCFASPNGEFPMVRVYAALLTAILSAISVSATLRSQFCVRSANASLSARQVSRSAATP